jgi:hypothetical protein
MKIEVPPRGRLAVVVALLLCALTATFLVARVVSRPAPAPAKEEPRMGSGSGASGTGIVLEQNGFQLPYVAGPNPLFSDSGSVFVPVMVSGNVLCDGGYCLSPLTLDNIGPSFTVSLAYSGTGGGTFEIGQTGSPCNPTYVATPAANSGTINHPSAWVDNQGNSTTTSAANNLASPKGSAYTSLNTSGLTITASISETQTSPPVGPITKTATGCTFLGRWGHGPVQDTAPGTGTYSIAASTSNWTVSNSGGGTVSGTLAGVLSTYGVGATWTETFSVAGYAFIAAPHQTALRTFNACAPTPCTPLVSMPVTEVATNVTPANQYGVSTFALDLYEAQAQEGALTYQITATQ